MPSSLYHNSKTHSIVHVFSSSCSMVLSTKNARIAALMRGISMVKSFLSRLDLEITQSIQTSSKTNNLGVPIKYLLHSSFIYHLYWTSFSYFDSCFLSLILCSIQVSLFFNQTNFGFFLILIKQFIKKKSFFSIWWPDYSCGMKGVDQLENL